MKINPSTALPLAKSPERITDRASHPTLSNMLSKPLPPSVSKPKPIGLAKPAVAANLKPAPSGSKPLLVSMFKPLPLKPQTLETTPSKVMDKPLSTMSSSGASATDVMIEPSAGASPTDPTIGPPNGAGATDVTLVPPTPSPAPAPLTLEGLAKVWGTADTTYDFTSDGIVNVQDLLYMMDNWEKIQAAGHSPGGPAAQVTIDDPPAGVSDPAMEVKDESTIITIEPDSINDPPAAGDAAGSAALPDEPNAPAIDDPPTGVSDPADSTSPVPDSANAPATPQTLDLRAYLSTLISGDEQRAISGGLNGAAARAAISVDGVRGRSAHSMGGLKPLADSLFDHLASAGFAEQPPTNIRELVGALNLSPRQTDFLLKQLAVKYPAGLGVNVIG